MKDILSLPTCNESLGELNLFKVSHENQAEVATSVHASGITILYLVLQDTQALITTLVTATTKS